MRLRASGPAKTAADSKVGWVHEVYEDKREKIPDSTFSLESEVRLLVRRLDDLILLNRLIQPAELYYLREMIAEDLRRYGTSE